MIDWTAIGIAGMFFVFAVVAIVQQSRTAWEAQRRQADMTRLLVSAGLAWAPETREVARVVAMPPVPPNETLRAPHAPRAPLAAGSQRIPIDDLNEEVERYAQ